MFWTPRPTLETSSEPSLRCALALWMAGMVAPVLFWVCVAVGWIRTPRANIDVAASPSPATGTLQRPGIAGPFSGVRALCILLMQITSFLNKRPYTL